LRECETLFMLLILHRLKPTETDQKRHLFSPYTKGQKSLATIWN
jgi:hypothetical protein